MVRYAIYLRVSTRKQGASGLGLEAQRKVCNDFVATNSGEVVQEFVDVESGTHRDRKGLLAAIDYCKKNSTPLVIAKLDRLARDVEFCFKVVNTGVEIHFCDMPQINTLLLGVFAAVAQYERELTSDRTKKALAAKKARGELIGAACDKYKATQASKDKATLREEQARKGASRTRSYQMSRDVVVFTKVMRNTFPTATSGEPNEWAWNKINLKKNVCKKMLATMHDYADLDSDLFKSWNFQSDNVQKLRSYVQAYKKSYNK